MNRYLLLLAFLNIAISANVNAGAPFVRVSTFGNPALNGPVKPGAPSPAVMMPCPIFTNEIHYDDAGGDTGERIEIAGDVGTDLTGWSIYLYTGDNGTVYSTIPMSGTIPASPSCVVGGRTLGFVTFDVVALTGTSFQNGSPDGWALVNGTTVVEFYSYEGTFTGTDGPANGLNTTDIGVSEPSTALEGSSIQRTGAASWVFADGTNTFGNCNTTQYSPSCSSTPTVNLSVSASQGAEATSTVITVTASTSAAVSAAETVMLAVTGTGITGGDYTLSNTTIMIPNGSSTGTVTFTVMNDVLVEGLETAVLTISNPSAGIILGPNISQNIAIYDNDLAAGVSCMFFANEIHYQNLSTDLNERIEIAGDAGSSLTGWSIVFYDGSTGAPYATANLSGTIPNVGTCVVGTRTIGTVVVDVVAATGFAFANGGVGSPDGWALCFNSTVVEFLSYDGTFTGTAGPATGQMSVNIGVTEDPNNPSANGSIQRSAVATWVVGASTNTFGACNTTQYAPCIGPTVTTIVTNVSCNGESTGAIAVTASDSPAPYNVSWSGPSSGNPPGNEIAVSGGTYNITGLVAGTYTVSVTDATNQTTTASVTVTQPAAIVLTETHVNVLCNGAATGSIDLMVTGGTGAYSYAWSNGPSTQDISGLVAGTYTVTVTDANLCTKTTSITITEPTAIVLSTTIVNSCAGGANGAVDLTVTGGIPGYTYSWSSGQGTEDISGLTAGPYTVTVTDGNFCTKTTSVTIGNFPLPTAAIAVAETSGVANNDGIICSGASVTLTASGGVSYAWSTGELTDAITVSPAGTTTYTVVVTDVNGCTSATSTEITVNPTPVAIATPAEQTICSGESISTIVLSSNVMGTTFTWTRDNTVAVTGIAASGSGDISGTLTNTTNADVTVTFTITPSPSNGCAGSPITATIIVYPEPTVDDVTDQTVCNGVSTAAVTFTGAVAGTTYTWTNDNPSIGLAADGTGDIASFTATNTGNVPVTATITVTPSKNNTSLALPEMLYYRFNGSGTSVPNLATNPPAGTANATIEGGLTQGGSAICDGTLIGNGLQSGVNYLNTGWATNLSGSWTISFKTSNIGPSSTLFYIFGDVNANSFRCFTNGVAGPNNWWLRGTGMNDVPLNGGATVAPHTCAFVYDAVAGNIKAYLDGVLVNTVAQSTSLAFTGAGPFKVSGYSSNVGLPLNGYMDEFQLYSHALTDVEVAELASSCTLSTTCTGDPQTFTITVNPTPDAVATPSSQTICSGATITPVALSGNVANTTFNWTRDNTGTVTGIAANGSGDISGALTNTTSAPVTVTFTITPTANGCPGTPITATVIVNPTPNAVATPASQTICSGSAITTIALTGNVANTTFDWTRDNTGTVTGIAVNGSGDISGSLTNTTNAPVTVTFTITPTANGCPGTPITATVIVNPTPNAVATPSSQTICSGAAITTIAFTGNVANTTFNWTRDNTGTVTGIAAAGSGDISGSLTNTTNGPVTVTFTITPTANGCPGTPITATVLVNPTPNAVATPSSQTICSGAAITSIVLSGNVAGTTYTWTRDNTGTVTGIAASGNGDISGSLTNTTNAPVTVTFTITPSANNCTGSTTTATVIVNPTPNAIATPASQITCSGASITTIVLTGNVANTTFNWMRNNTGTVTGIAANGSGNISGVLTNTTNAPITVTFTITPTANGCPGAPVTATVTVNPLPDVTATPQAQTICSGNAITTVVFTGNVPGTTFNWVRNSTATVTGIAANGSGNISGSLTNTTNAPITVTFTVTPTANGCSPGAPTLVTVLVNPTPQAFTVTGGGGYCLGTDPGVPVGLSGSQTNVNYQLQLNGMNTGAPVMGTGSAISFGVQSLAGNYTVVATHTQGGCTNAMTGTVNVFSFNCSVSISDPCVCLNNATTLTNGQFGEQIKVNAPSTQTWTVTAISGLFSTASPAPPSAPNPITVGTVLQNIGGNMFTLDGRHIDAIGYTISVFNGINTTLTIGNTCQYPNPSITSDLSAAFCVNSDPVTLTGNPGDANIVSQGFTVNGVAATQFDPGAGVGQYTIVYTVDGGAPKASGANDPGCIQSVSQIVNVIATPSAIACNNNVQISLDEDCETEILPDMILEGTYGCFDDYKVELDKTTPLGNGPWLAPIVGVNDINKTYGAKVTHLVSGVSCWGTISIEDKLAPVVICSTFNIACAETNYDPAYLANTLGITAAYPTVTENCGTYDQSYTDQWFDLPCPPSPTPGSVTAYIIRTWVVTDASGNSSTCSQTINIIGSRVYDVQFPADVTISCGANVNTNPGSTGTPYITFDYPAVDVDYPIWPGSNYCELQSTYVDQILPVCDGTYKILRTWTVYDWCVPTSPFPPTVNPQYYIQVIKVTDETGPTFACPADMTVSTDAYNCCATTELPDIIMSDNCSRINHVSARVLVYDPYTGDLVNTLDMDGWLTTFPGNNLWNPDTLANFGLTPCLPIGQHTVIYTATDDCGNHSTCSFELEVRDLTPPVTACDEWTQVALGINGMAFVNATTFDDGSYDNCGDVFFKARRMNQNDCQPNTNFYDQVKFCCEDIGDTILVVLRVYDVDPGTGNVGLEDYEGHYNDCMVQALVEDKIKPVCTAPANVTVSCEAFDPSYWAYGQATATDNCCIDTITNTVVLSQFDSLCNKGTITRRWTAIDCAGNTSQCTQRIIVQYEQHYFVKFPADRLVSTCDGTGNYGAPEFYGEDCELLATSFMDEIFTVVPDACFKIERTWTVINWCTYNPNLPCIYVPNPNPSNTTNAPANLAGVTVSECGNTVLNWNPTVVKINPSDPLATNYCTFWSANANCYQYKQIIKVYDTQDPSVVTPTPGEYCDYSTNDGAFWNASYYWDATISSHDLCEGDANIELTATDACSGANISFRYLLFLDLDGDGTMETVVNSVNPPGFNNVNYNNYQNANYAGGIPQQFDFRSVPFNQKWGFGLQTDAAAGNNRTARVRWFNQLGQNAVPQLPYGNHKIKWFVEDGCGNEYIYEQPLVVKDCKKPTVVCLNGLSVNLMNTNPAMVQLWASDFLQYTEDNCTPANQLKIAIRRSGTGTGFPTNPDGTPQTGVQFDCNDLGTQLVELWSIDKAGNADFCETYILIQDNMGVCGQPAVVVAGALKTEQQEGVQDATVELDGESNGVPLFSALFSDPSGQYAFSNALPIAANATVTPTMELDPLNGVNTYDLILISRHILGLEPLSTSFKLISADANKSGTITTFDIVELRKLILGTYTVLPNNSSWRFVDKTQVFNDPNNPFAETIRENLQFANIQGSINNGDFVGAKIGDVDNTAIPNHLVSSEERNNGRLLFDIDDRSVTAGESFNLVFTADQTVKGYQFTLNMNGLRADVLENSAAMSDENFAFFNDAVTTSWDAPTVFTGKAQFTLRFTALKSGKISEMLSVSSRITRAQAYELSSGEARGEVGLRFNGKGASVVSGVGFELYQNTPNPWVTKTQIGFYLPEAANARLTIYDATGRTLYTAQGDFAKGYNAFTVDRKLVQTTGSLYYKVETDNDSDVKQMIQLK